MNFFFFFNSAQPQRLPQLQPATQESSKEETGKIKNGGPTSLSNGNGIHHGAKHAPTDNHKISAPVSQKMHRKIQSSLSVNNDSSKKNKVNALFSQKSASSPEGKWGYIRCAFFFFLSFFFKSHVKLFSSSKLIRKT